MKDLDRKVAQLIADWIRDKWPLFFFRTPVMEKASVFEGWIVSEDASVLRASEKGERQVLYF